MKTRSLLIAVAMTLLAAPAFAQATSSSSVAPPTPAPAGTVSVQYKSVSDMPTLVDPKKFDSFSTTLHDAQVDTTLILSCSAGHSALFGLAHANKECGFQQGSSGLLFNPKKSDPNKLNTWMARTQYSGQYTVSGDGTTDATTLTASYMPNGEKTQFGGSMNLKPELTSTGAQGLKDLILKKLQVTSNSGPIDDRTDTIDFNNFYVPSAGLPSDKGCTWQGNAVYTYQNGVWYWKVSAICSDARYDFQGNMSYQGDSTKEGTAAYNIMLTLGTGAAAGGGAQTDDALFSNTSDDSLFNDVTGITGVLTMQNSHIVTVTLDGKPIQTPEHVETSGNINGSGVPLPVVRSFAMLIGLLPSTFYGA